MVELTDEQAEAEFGEDLHSAVLAAVVETEKIRVVHDGTNKVHVSQFHQGGRPSEVLHGW